MAKKSALKGRKWRILIPDAEWEILTDQVKNCFSIQANTELYLMSNNRYIPNRFSRFIRHFSYYPKTDRISNWIEYINIEVEKHGIDFIMPIYEDGIRALISNRKLVKKTDSLMLMPSQVSFDTANNKVLLAEHLLQHEISGPEMFKINSNKNFKSANMKFPMMAKPIEGSEGGNGIFVFKKESEIETHLKGGLQGQKFLFQKYIEGYDIDCSVLCKNGEIKAFTIQKGNLYSNNPCSPAIGLEFLFERELFKTVKKLMRTLNWSGVAHIDLRYDKSDHLFKVIEVNTRFWSSLEASLIAGVNFPYLYCLLVIGQDFDLPEYNNVKTLNLKGLVKQVRNNGLFLTKIGFIWNNTSIRYAISDPLPVLVRFFLRAKNLFFSFLKKI
ncbi:ATP-grasp domain-containing protein [Ulvibacterium marinum]|uniref:ATP-grasp domain-containing protein n=1 Tax=Ulvibacterium marinum TaxID=2419782 RepID=UPI0024952E2C|nr:ATP-grasp domain-containing protein [Ulvibacterium marinum]